MTFLNEFKYLTSYNLMKNLALSSSLSIIILLFVFACRDSKPVDFSNLISRGGLVYYNKPNTLIGGKGISSLKTLFNGECVKYYPTGTLQGKGLYNNGILVRGSYLGMDGTLLESTETKDDTTISIEWYSTGQKRWESKTTDGKVVSINRWHEDGKIRKELYDWEEEAI